MADHIQPSAGNWLKVPKIPPFDSIKGYLLSALCAGVGLVIRLALDPLWGDRLPYAIFFLANLFVLQFVEVGPFIFTVSAGFILGNWFFVTPRHSFLVGSPVNQVNAVLYFVISLVVLYFSQRARGARRKEQTARETLRRNLEELQESEARYSAVVRNSIDAILLTDAEERILAANPAACRMFGRTEDELLQIGRLALVDPADRERVARKQGEIAGTPRMEVTFVRNDGGKFTGEISTGGFRDRNGGLKCSSIIRDITDRKRAEARLESLNKELVAASRQAGMAEIASSVLHNVGNVLNTVNVSATVVRNAVRLSKTATLAKVVFLLREKQNNLAAFLTTDASGKQLLPFLSSILEQLQKERSTVTQELDVLLKSVEHIKQIVAHQQSYARMGGLLERVKVVDIVEDALRLYPANRGPNLVKVIREFEDVPPTLTNRHQVLAVLVNLLQNAHRACDDANNGIIKVRIRPSERERVSIEVADNGIGIAPENLTKIFGHGFTTRKNGHGFGLHSGALAAREMGGSLVARSDGLGKGATFILELPLVENQAAASTST